MNWLAGDNGYCILVKKLLTTSWAIAPLGADSEYVFRSWDEAITYARASYDSDDLIEWRVVPFEIKK